MKKIEDYKGTKTAIEVNSIEEFDKIKKLLGYTKQSGAICFKKNLNYISCDEDGYCSQKWYLKLGYKLLKSSDFLEESIPEYVELLPGFDSKFTGKIFNTNQAYPENWGKLYKSWQWLITDIHKVYFKPSTKEAYDLQNQPNLIKDKIYVALFEDKPNFNSIFKCEIDYYLSHRLYLDGSKFDKYSLKSCCWNKSQNITFRDATEDEIKWIEACIIAGKLISKEEALKPKFEVGKWYKSPKWSQFWIKCSNFDGKTIFVNEKINGKELITKRDSFTSLIETYVELTDLSEIQEFLPDGHIDKIKKQMTEEEILEKAKRDYPIGTVFKQVDNNEEAIINEMSFKNIDKNEWFTKDYLIINWSDKYGNIFSCIGAYLFKNGVWAEIVSKPESTPINTYGLYVGMKLPEDIINKWSVQGNNYYKGCHGWIKETGVFIGNRKILSFKELNGIIGFEVSGTFNVFLKAEGFKEFMDNFNKPEIKSTNSELPEKWCLKITKDNLNFCRNLSNYELGFSKNYDYTIGGYYSSVATKSGSKGSSNLEDRIEITFEQFKRLVFKKNTISVEVKTINWTPKSNSLELPYQLNQVFETENNSNQPIYLEYQELKPMNYKQDQISQPILKEKINLQIIKIN